MADDGNGDAKLHIAMLPWLAFGHLIPYLELAKLMAFKDHKIYFISTPRNRLPQLSQSMINFVTFVKINLPKVDNLTENAESTKELPLNKVSCLKIACDGLREPVADFFKASSPDWIFFDFNTYWLGPMAAEHGVVAAYFSVFPALVLGFLGSPEVMIHRGNNRATPEDFIKRPKWVSFESQVRPTLFQINRARENSINSNKENIRDAYRLGATVKGCDAVVVRSSFDFEPDWLNLLMDLYQKLVIHAGLLPAIASDDNACWLETKEWLDKHEKGTVVYIGFGTETKPNQYELTQLALGLELSGLPFYWVLRDQRGSSDDEIIELPGRFEDRTRGHGVVCRSWAPQFKILSHDSVGGLLIHSGMGSLVEGLQLGKPLVLLPLLIDQDVIASYLVENMGSLVEGLQLGKPLVLLPLLIDQDVIASYLVEKKMGYMVPRYDVDGSFPRKSVADALSLVMVREEGKVYRERAKRMMSLVGDQDIKDKYVDELIYFLQKSLK